MFECKIGREMLYFLIENTRGELEKQPRLRGGLRFVFLIRMYSDYPRIENDVLPVSGDFLCNLAVLFFVAGAIIDEVG